MLTHGHHISTLVSGVELAWSKEEERATHHLLPWQNMWASMRLCFCGRGYSTCMAWAYIQTVYIWCNIKSWKFKVAQPRNPTSRPTTQSDKLRTPVDSGPFVPARENMLTIHMRFLLWFTSHAMQATRASSLVGGGSQQFPPVRHWTRMRLDGRPAN